MKIVWICKCETYPSLDSNKLKVLIHSTSTVTIPSWLFQRQITYILNTPGFFGFFNHNFIYFLRQKGAVLLLDCEITFFIATVKWLPSFLWHSAIFFSLKYLKYLFKYFWASKDSGCFIPCEIQSVYYHLSLSRYPYPFQWLIFLVL